jgi:peptidoglycan/xylan/chitin deacetylase (PgdA/CDA1 family)
LDRNILTGTLPAGVLGWGTRVLSRSAVRSRRGWRRPLTAVLALAAVVLLVIADPGLSLAGSEELSRAGVPESSLTSLNIALLKSGYTSSYFLQEWAYNDVVNRWLTFLAANGVRHRLITDSELEQGRLDEFSVLVLPGALCLSKQEKEAVRSFLRQGKGVISSWAVGVRSENGDWSGWSFLEELTGSRFKGYINGAPAAWVTLSGKTPLSAGLEAGSRMELLGGWKVALSETPSSTYWSDYSLDYLKTSEDSSTGAAVVQAPCGDGRAVWFGFNSSDVITRPKDQAELNQLLLNALLWSARTPTCQVFCWPGGHDAAVVFSQDVEYLFENAANAVQVLREEQIRGTFFCVSDLAADTPELVKALADVGEVGTHSDNHEQFQGQTFDLQKRRLKESSEALERMGAPRVIGFRPPYELCDEATLRAWVELGGRFMFGQPEYDPRMTPQIVTVPEGDSQGPNVSSPLVLLSRVGRDDHGTLNVEALTDNAEILEQHKSDMDWVTGLGGLYMFGYHSNLICLPERIDVLRQMVRYAKSRDVWITTAGDVAVWWKARSKVSAEVSRPSEDVLSLSVRNAGTEPVDGVTLMVRLPRAPGAVNIESNSPGLPSIRHDLEGDELKLYVDDLKGDGAETYTITLQ